MNPGFLIAATESGIKEVELKGKREDVRSRGREKSTRASHWEAAVKKELRAYFAGRLRSFSTPCDLGSLPPFTQAVLKVTESIPYGEIRSYRWIAEKLGKPRATRAVGNALARNPIPFIIPCHRVVRSDGSLGGYALGLSWKKRLLKLEKSVQNHRDKAS
jgi:methylated-DNA-[protein]-cysteine S-methyltransferase